MVVGWAELKSFVDARDVPIQMVETDKLYLLRAIDGGFHLTATITKTVTPPAGSDQKDFEDNYKNLAITNSSPSQRDYVSVAVKEKKSFTSTTDLLTIGSNAEVPLLLLKNPSASGVKIMITKFKFGTDSANTRTIIRIYANPTVTANGTALTITNTYIASSLPTPLAETYKSPTVSSNGNILNMDINPINSHSKGLNRTYWVDPGSSVLMTVQNNITNAATFGDIYWLEGV